MIAKDSERWKQEMGSYSDHETTACGGEKTIQEEHQREMSPDSEIPKTPSSGDESNEDGAIVTVRLAGSFGGLV
jgi:hypothetical protein